MTAGTGAAYLYIDTNGVLTLAHNLALSCTSPCVANAGTVGFPVNSLPLYMWTATAGSWDASGGVDERAVLNSKVLLAGSGIATLDTGSATTISVDAAVVPRYLTATASLGFASIPAGGCSTDQTFSLAGASVGDSVAPGPASFAAGLTGMMWVSAPGTISVRICNFSGGIFTLAAAVYRCTVVRSF